MPLRTFCRQLLGLAAACGLLVLAAPARADQVFIAPYVPGYPFLPIATLATPAPGSDLVLIKLEIPENLYDVEAIGLMIFYASTLAYPVAGAMAFSDGGVALAGSSILFLCPGPSCIDESEYEPYVARFELSPPLQPGDRTAVFGIAFPAGSFDFSAMYLLYGFAGGAGDSTGIGGMIPAPAPASTVLYGLAGGAPGRLIRIERNAGISTVVGSLGVDLADAGLAYDPAQQVFYGLDGNASQAPALLRIDPETGSATAVGAVTLPGAPPGSVPTAPGLEFDPVGQRLYLTDALTDKLYSIDPATAQATEIGPLGILDLGRSGLALDPGSGTLYAVTVYTPSHSQLYAIDTATGAATYLYADLGIHEMAGLAFDPDSGRLYTIDTVQSPPVLYSIDVTGCPAACTSLAVTPVGPIEHDDVEGLAFVSDPGPSGFVVSVLGPQSFDPDASVMDASLGITPAHAIEDFEDTALETGLQVLVDGLAALTLWDSAVLGEQDGVWTIDRALYNEQGAGQDGKDVEFVLPAGVRSFGVGIGLSGGDLEILVNGQSLGLLSEHAQWVTSPDGRNGYVRVTATGSASITSVKFDAVEGDAILYDHAAWLAPAPVPSASPLLLAVAILAATALARTERK